MFTNSKTLLPGIDLHRNRPVNLEEEDLRLFHNYINKQLPSVRLFEYEDVNVTAESIIWKGFKIANELLIYPNHTEIYNWKYTLSNRYNRRMLKVPHDEYILCTDYWGDGYFHWMCDALPRVMLLKDKLEKGVLLLPEHYQAGYYNETLNAFNIREIKRVPLKNYLRVNHLITAEQPTISGDHRPELIKEVRQHLLEYFRPKFTGNLNKQNIYVSRNKAKYRKVLNESDLLPVLRKYDFEVVFFEDYSMTEQIELAHSAKNIISLHGANLTNVMFMKPGGNVMEFRKNNDTENNYYYALTDSVDCNYFYQNCDYIDRRVGNFFDVTVDVELLEKNIRLMMDS